MNDFRRPPTTGTSATRLCAPCTKHYEPMHTAEIAAILKGGQGWVKVDVEAGSVEALRLCAPSCMGRKQVRQKGIDELRCGELVLELAKKQGRSNGRM